MILFNENQINKQYYNKNVKTISSKIKIST